MDDRTLAMSGIVRQAALVRSGAVSSRELTSTVLRRIEALNPRLRAFTLVLADEAMSQATARDQVAARGTATDLPPLHGVPVAIKAENDVRGVVTTYGGAACRRIARSDAEIVRRLREAGAVVVGITAMPEFGLWPFTESAAYGYTRNPWDDTRSTFGSSGGSAAAVAAGLVGAAVGGDGGGSIRLPAAATGLFGLKPQRGRVSTAPNPDLWHLLGTLGGLTRSVADSALFYDVVSGSTDVDRFQAEPSPIPYAEAARGEPGRLRIAVSTKSPVRGITPCREHRHAVSSTAELLARLGHEVVERDPVYPDATTQFVPQMLGGLRDEASRVDQPDLLERRTRTLLRMSRAIPNAAVRQAERRTEELAATVNGIFDDVDLLLQPVTPQRPPRIGVLDGAGAVTALLRSTGVVAYTGLWNLVGNPAASVPAGRAADGLPLAVQLVGRPHAEHVIVAVSAQLERERPWSQLQPPIS